MSRRPVALAAALACAAALSACAGSAPGGAATSAAGGSGGTARATARTGAAAAAAAGDWTRFDYDAVRSGAGPADTGITAANAHELTVRPVHIDGVADSSAIALHAVDVGGLVRDVAIVTTTYGRTIAFDPGSGVRLWEFVPPDVHAYEGSSQITTATPVLDPDRRYAYAASPDGLIHKLSVADGREVRSRGWPARVTFDPTREKIAAALNLSGRYVVAVTGGYFGDAPSYQGHVALIDRASGRVAHVWNSLCSNRHRLIDPPRSCPASDSAIWGRAGAVIEPGSRRIVLATGNGPWNGATNWGDSVLELSPDARRLLQSWTPRNQRQLEAADTDVGSTGPALLPARGRRRWAVQGGKDAHLYLLDLRRLNGTRHAGPRLGGELQTLSAPGGGQVLTAPAVWGSGGRSYVFVATDSGTSAYVLAGRPRPRLRGVWQLGAAGTSPVIAGGLLYVYDPPNATLDVRDPLSGRLIASLGAAGGHWSSPIVTGGRVILPVGGSTANNATSGTVLVYHLPGR